MTTASSGNDPSAHRVAHRADPRTDDHGDDRVDHCANAGLLGVRRVLVPLHAVAAVETHLRDMGRQRVEGVAFWAGTQDGATFRVQTAVVPPQRAGRLGGGLAVVIDGDTLFRMNVWLHRQRMTLVAQLHSHPGDAYHSDTDDAYAVLTRVGGLSIVLPDFARTSFAVETAAIYRLDGDGRWAQVPSAAARDLIVVED